MRLAVSGGKGLLTFSPAFVSAALFVVQSFAAPPPLDALFPSGGERASTNIVIAVGKFETWPPKVWLNGSGVVFTAETNKGKFSVSIAPDATPGPRLVRLYNEDGVSDARFFVVGATREMFEREPNDRFAAPQQITNLPVTINGRLDKNGDVDSFALDMRAGEWLEARVDCYTLMSKVDAVLRLVTTNGQQLAWNHDFITLDPRLVWRAAADGPVVLQMFGFAHPPGSDIGFTGGEAAVYRLHLALTNQAPQLCSSPFEQALDDKIKNREPIPLPALIQGTIRTPTNEERIYFGARKGETFEAHVEAASFGSSLDAWLAIENAAGKQLARNDDADGSRDPRLEWTAPTNGNFVVVVGSLTHRGGDDYCYRLSVEQVKPDYRAMLASGSLVLTPGATNDFKIDVKRLRGFTNDLKIIFKDLPEGVVLLTTNLPQKESAISLRLAANEDAPAFQGPTRLAILDVPSEQERPVSVELTTRGETGFNHLLIETADQFWLTVRRKPAAQKIAAEKK